MVASTQQNAAATSSTILVISSSRSRMDVIFCAHFCNLSRCSTCSSWIERVGTGSEMAVPGLVAMVWSPSRTSERGELLTIRCPALGVGFCFRRRGNALCSLGTLSFDLCQTLTNPLFHTFGGRTIVDTVAQVFGQTLDVSNFVFEVVRVLIALAVSQALHQPGRCVAQVQGDGLGGGTLHVVLNFTIGRVQRVGFGRH